MTGQSTRSNWGPARFSEETIEAAKRNIREAFRLAGLGSADGLRCPSCGKTGRNRIKLFEEDGGWRCFSANWCGSGSQGSRAVGVLMDQGWSFRDAVAALTGHDYIKPKNAPQPLESVDVPSKSFKAEVDSEVYEFLWSLADTQAAVEYYGKWAISPAAVREARCARLTDPKAAVRELTQRFGRERVESSGLLVPPDDNRLKDYWVVNHDYPVIEPQLSGDGVIVGVQFRPSEKRSERIKAHKEYKKLKNAAEAQGEEFREPKPYEKYCPPFSSLRGGTPGEHLVGIGLPRLMALQSGSVLYIAEGAKDAMAAWTMGMDTYAVPGVSVRPPIEALKKMRLMTIKIAFDADEGGETGTEKILSYFAYAGIVPLSCDDPRGWISENAPFIEEDRLDRLLKKVVAPRRAAGLDCLRARPPAGMDLADVLMASAEN